MTESDPHRASETLALRHLRLGWCFLLLFVALGIVLESMHGLKIGWYLDVTNETRRLMWTLSHTHGTLLAIVHLVFAASVRSLPSWSASSRTLASRCLFGAAILLPMGFLLGGLFIQGGDPGLGILLVPPGALLLVIAIGSTALAALREAGPAS